MNKISKVGLIALATAGLALADSWSGELVAARCKQESYGAKAQSAEGCAPIETKVFGVMTADGTVFRFDDAGNRQVAASLREAPKKQNVTVSGSFDGRTVQVQSIDIH